MEAESDNTSARCYKVIAPSNEQQKDKKVPLKMKSIYING